MSSKQIAALIKDWGSDCVKMDNLLRALEDGQMDYDLIGSRLRGLETLRAQKNPPECPAGHSGGDYYRYGYYFSLRQRLVDRSDPLACREIIEHMVERVIIQNNTAQLELRFAPCGQFGLTW